MTRFRDCDLVLAGGRVVDPESGLDTVTDVAVSGGTVVAVGDSSDLRPAQTLDVSGHVVTAGFIDLHSHAQTIPSLRLQALDGVTTALELESGAGDVTRALASAAAEGRPVNYGYSTSWAQARMSVLDGMTPGHGPLGFAAGIGERTGWQRPANPAELARIIGRLEEEIGAGALGVGVLLGYAPRTGRREYLGVASTAARLGVPTFTHARFKNRDDPESALEGVAEIVAAAAGTGAHMHLCHLNSTALRAIDEVADLISGARARGLAITTEAYPYGAGMTAVGAPFLSPDHLPRLGLRPSDLVVVATGERPAGEDRLRRIRRDTPGALVLVHYLDEGSAPDLALIRRALLLDDTAVASDAVPFTDVDGTPIEGDRPMPPGALSHPRSSGTFSRFLRTMVRETATLSLSEALRRCSLLPATFLQATSPAMARKGRVRAGHDADLVVFDLAEVEDRSTYRVPAAASIGFKHVFVGGEAVVRDGALVPSALPGRAIVGGAR
ncbi:amidohydrolase family protein [Micromonospora sp. DR5-3]|uniref:amidohydrolase family protein n=1 Tax=unclassified Micromonospora TaxID=2617518 RepID=UPI0011D2EB55|nr:MULTISPECIES: amidohydrolase family protein [unclassified Micromonospora]MCW3820504.1 amidohydrolase family protein [Micromonospora sp. DR5-3]TYC21810.1 amidohydrolase family protein [Micromonospora sp. MP36]